MRRFECAARDPITIKVTGNYQGRDGFAARLEGKFTDQNNRVLRIPGFYLGNNEWAVRFAAEEDSVWNYSIYSDDICLEDDCEGIITVSGAESELTRTLRIKNQRFITANGKSIFIAPFECDFLFSMVASPDGHKKLEVLVQHLKEYGFNQVVVNSFAWDSEYFKGKINDDDYGPACIDMWRPTEYGRQLNPDYFENYDYMVDYLHKNGIYIQIYLRVYNKFVKWDPKYSQAEEDYMRTFIARYEAYPNVVWNITKEGYFEKDKNYIYHLFQLVDRYDAYKHLKTIHDDDEYVLDPKYAHTVDFITVQKFGEFSYMLMYFRERSKKLVVNGELGNDHQRSERLINDPRMHEPDGDYYNEKTYARFAWQNVMGGGYACYYYRYLCWDVIEYDVVPRGFKYFKIMKDFFSQYDLTKFVPAPELSAWSGVVLDDHESTVLIYMDPKKNDRYNYFDRATTMLNPDNGRKYTSFEAFGVYTGKTMPIAPEPIAEPGSLKEDYFADNIVFDIPWIEEPVVIICKYQSTK